MLTCKCDGCDSSSYAIPGSQAYQQRMQSIEALAPKPASEPAPASPSAPESHPNGPHSVAKTRPAFSLQNL